MRILMVITFLIGLMAFTITNPNPLVGKWETKATESGTVTAVVFKENNEFDSYINNTPYISGVYSVKDRVVAIMDDRCGDITGRYELLFYSNSDSLRLEAIEDVCGSRKIAIESVVLGRVKK